MEDVEMDVSPTDFDPRDFNRREKFRRYGKSPLSQYDGSASRLSEIRPNTMLLFEDVKQEVESLGMDREGTLYTTHITPRRRLRAEDEGRSELDFGEESGYRSGIRSLKSLKQEEDEYTDSRDTTFSMFASLLDSALQGLMPFQDLILRFESACRDVSESIRSGSIERHRIVEDKLMRQKAKLLLDEAASWSLLWYIFGKGNESLTLLILDATLLKLDKSLSIFA